MRRTSLSRHELGEWLRADLAAHGMPRWRWHHRMARPQLHYQRLLRRVEYLSTRRAGSRTSLLYILYRLALARRSQLLGLSIPPGVFGPGLSIAHYGTIVVNDKAVIGRYCRIHVNTTIGEYGGEAPSIGEFVYIGPGAVLFGGITVGDRAVIGANSVVREDVPPGVTVAGVPARVVSNRDSSGVMPAPIARIMKAAPRD